MLWLFLMNKATGDISVMQSTLWTGVEEQSVLVGWQILEIDEGGVESHNEHKTHYQGVSHDEWANRVHTALGVGGQIVRVGVAVDKYKNHPDAPPNDCCFRITYKTIDKCPHRYYEVSDAEMFGDKVAAVLECLDEFRREHLASGCVVLGLHTATFGGGGEDGEEDAMTNENTDSTANPVAPPLPVGNPMVAYFWENQASIDAANASFDASADHGACQARDKIKITYERYQTVSRAIIMHLRKQEAGLSKQDIIDWHVSAQTEIADHGREGEVRVVRSVLKNMLQTDHSLVTANDVGEGGEPKYTVTVNLILIS